MIEAGARPSPATSGALLLTIPMRSDQGVDAVTIAAPTHLHRDIAIACAARGIHVMVEKPIAPTVEESRAIVAAAGAPASR